MRTKPHRSAAFAAAVIACASVFAVADASFFDVAGTNNTASMGAGSTAVIGNPNVPFVPTPNYSTMPSSGFFGNPAVDSGGISPNGGGVLVGTSPWTGFVNSTPFTGGTYPATGGGSFFGSGAATGSFFGSGATTGSVPVTNVPVTPTAPVTGGVPAGGSQTNSSMVCIGSRSIDIPTLNNMLQSGQLASMVGQATPEQRQQMMQLGVIDANGQLDVQMMNTLINSGVFACPTTTGGVSGGGSVSSGGGFFGTAPVASPTFNPAPVTGSAPVAGTYPATGGGSFFNVNAPASSFGLFQGIQGLNSGTPYNPAFNANAFLNTSTNEGAIASGQVQGSTFGFNEALLPQYLQSSSVPLSLQESATFSALSTTTDQNLVIVAYGDSVVRGVGASQSGNFVSRLSQEVGRPIINAGNSGWTTADALANLNSQVIPLNPDVVILFIGGNDILQGIPAATMFSNIQQIVTRLQQNGATVILMGIHGPVFNINFETGYQQVAAQTGALYVPNVLQGIIANPSLMADPVHPNDAGHQVIADRVESTLRTAILIEEAQNPNQNLQVTCSANPQQATTGTTVFWTANPTGGTGSYSFTWSGTDSLTGNQQQTSKAYSTSGTKSATVTVQSGTASTSATCTTQISSNPLVGSCAVAVGQMNDGRFQVTWSAFSLGGTGSETYAWRGNNGFTTATSTVPSVTMIYNTPGLKTGTVTVASGGQSFDLNCSANIPAASATSTSPVMGSCVVSGPLAINYDTRWAATPATTGNMRFDWSGTDGLSASNTPTAIVRYTTPGKKTGTVSVIDNNAGGRRMDLTCEAMIATTPPTGAGVGIGGCFIATAAFGTEMEPHVATLRKFRDEKLLTNKLGEKFVETYYAVSPPVADMIRENETLKAVVRTALKPFVFMAERSLEEEEQEQ